MAALATEVDSLTTQSLVKRAIKQSKENFDESEILYTIELLEAGLQDILKEVQELRKDFEEIEEDTEIIKEELNICASRLENDTESSD